MNATRFLKQAMQHPARTGALAPSSKQLSQSMVENAQLANARFIVELGPGTGAITHEILTSKLPATQYLGIERNAQFVELLEGSFPQKDFICDDAANLRHHVLNRSCDRILSGLPWAGFSPRLQSQLLGEIAHSLSDDGLFLTFAYHPFNHFPRGRSFKRLLHANFSHVTKTEMIRNFPPASIYICTR